MDTQVTTGQALALDDRGKVSQRVKIAKLNSKRAVVEAVLGGPGKPGMLLRGLANLAKLQDKHPDNADVQLDVYDRLLRTLPYIWEKEGEAGESAGNALAAALRGHGGPIQIVFGQHFHGRDGQAGQALPGNAGPDAGAGPISPASQP